MTKTTIKFLSSFITVLFLMLVCLNLRAQNSLEIRKGYTRVKIAENLVLDIKGEYPEGYKPRWKYWDIYNSLTFQMDNYVSPRPLFKTSLNDFSILENNGKAAVRFNGCIGEIVTKDNVVFLTETPQSFKVINFKKAKNPAINCCDGKNRYHADIEGEITLSSNENGDIQVSLVMEEFRPASRDVSYRHTVKNLIVKNEMSVERAYALLNERKRSFIADSLEKIATAIRLKEESRLFELKINNSLPKLAALQNRYFTNYNALKIVKGEKEERYTYYESSSRAVPSGGFQSNGSPNYEMETTSTPVTGTRTVQYEGLKNTSNRKLMIKGITKLKSQVGTLYYEDASIELEPGEMTDTLFKIWENYNPSVSEIGSTNYYKAKIIIK